MSCCLSRHTGGSDDACASPTFSGIHADDSFTFKANYDVRQVPHMGKYVNTHAWKCCQKRKTKHKTPQPLECPPEHIRINWSSWGGFSLYYHFSNSGVKYRVWMMNIGWRNVEHLVEEWSKRPTWTPSTPPGLKLMTNISCHFRAKALHASWSLTSERTPVANWWGGTN